MGDDDQFRNYVPLLRRIIILVAVLTAVPVMMWTITAFVRGYVGPPKTPTFRPLAATVSVEAPTAKAASLNTGVADARMPSAAQQGTLSDAAPAAIEAKAPGSDAASPSPAAKGAFLGDRPPAGEAGRPATPAMIRSAALAAPITADTGSTQTSAADAIADGAGATSGALGVQQAALQEPADILPAAEPLTEAVPLPRARPHYFVLAQTAVPMPRPRPEASGGAAEAAAGPLDWLQKLFQPQPQQPQQQ